MAPSGMTAWIDVAPAADIASGSWRTVDAGDVEIVVVNVDGRFYAVEDQCTHDGGNLAGGRVEGCEIICPRHGARFDLRTGDVTAPPAYEPIETFPVRVSDGMVQIQIPG